MKSEIPDAPELWHAPYSHGWISASLNIFWNGLDITAEWGNPGTGFESCEGKAGFVFCVPLPSKSLCFFFLFHLLKNIV